MRNNLVKELIDKKIEFLDSLNTITEIENNLGCVDGRIIGTGRSDYTQGATTFDLVIGEKKFALIDIPGIEGDESLFEETIRNSLERAHTIFYVNGSGKKIEKATLNKIKRYMHDGTSVYALFNIHCKAKKERIEGIDKSFSEELSDAFAKQQEIIIQTEQELSSFLGKNFKGSLSINGLLSFCAMAMRKNGRTTIKEEKDKNLRSDQNKYMNEYLQNIGLMTKESRVLSVRDIINEKIENFDDYIYEENVKKLKNRLRKMTEKIEELRNVEIAKIKGFIRTYNEFESNCYNAKEDFIQNIRHVGYNATADAFATVKEALFEIIERDKGKTDSKIIQAYFEFHKNKIIQSIQDGVNEKMAHAQTDYKEVIADAQQRLVKDFEREQTKFEVSLAAVNVSLDGSFGDVLKYNLKDFGGHLFRTVSLALSGASIGSLVPGIGTAIGACIGAIVGVISSIWNYFASESTRINRAKEKLQRAIDDQVEEISEILKGEIKKLEYEKKINDSYQQICDEAEKQKESLERIENILNSILFELKMNYRKVA